MLHSKNIFNSAVFLQKRWYEVINVICKYHVKNIEQSLPLLTTNDCKVLFKYCLQIKDNETMKKIYQVSSNKKELLDLVKEKESFKVIKTKGTSKNGITQTPLDILNCICNPTIEKLITDMPFFDDVLPRLKMMLSKKQLNESQTLQKKEVTEENTDEKDDAEKEKGITNLLPPTYLGFGYMDLYVKMNIPSYELIGSQVAQQTIKKVDKCYCGFFGSLNAGIQHVKPPNYNKTNKFNLILQKDSFKIMEDGRIRLSLGLGFKKHFDENFSTFTTKDNKINPNLYHSKGKLNQNNHNPYKTINKPVLEKKFMYIKFNKQILSKKQIVEIEIVPSQYTDRDRYSIIIKYNIDKPTTSPKLDDNLNKASLDLGVSNLATMFSPKLPHPVIFDGKGVTGINKWFNSKIDNIKSEVKKKYGKSSCRAVQNLLTKRLNVISEYFHQITNSIIEYCKTFDISELIIGYNTNWKNKVNMGTNNNRTFYEVPYRKLINMLFYKGEQNNIKVVENEESYTSICDALGLEEVGFHQAYAGTRVKRGLFQSSKKVLLNADVNGAINIMRKYVFKTYTHLSSVLGTYIENINLKGVCNPIRIGKNLKVQSMEY